MLDLKLFSRGHLLRKLIYRSLIVMNASDGGGNLEVWKMSLVKKYAIARKIFQC